MELVTRRRKAQETELADKLNAVKYDIDSIDSIKLFGSGRIESVCYLFTACPSCSHNLLNACLVPASFALPRFQEAFTNYDTC